MLAGFLLVALLGVGCTKRATDILLPIGDVVVDSGQGGIFIKLDARIGQPGREGDVDPGLACSGTAEICNHVDDDCDGIIDNGFDFQNDPLNCGDCGTLCSAAGAVPACVKGTCTIASCSPGYVDADNNSANGCECLLTNEGKEACDGADNDCDGVIDNGFDFQTDANNCGACGVMCNISNADAFCSAGACGYTCKPGHYDIDKLSVDGCEYACTPSADPTETCDGVDNDCDGLVDGDDPSLVYVPADRLCYSSAAGSCQAGILTCVSGKTTCVGAGPASQEVCDGRDNNCDGRVDESDPNLGKSCYAPGVAGCDVAAGTCQGLCKLGAYACSEGSISCSGAVTPTLEVCDGQDNDCDGQADNGFDLDTDPNNCGGCGQKCRFANALAVCSKGVCVLDPRSRQGACSPGWEDADHDPANGCEYQCTVDGPEMCDGRDNDCNGLVDNDDPGLVFPINFCSQVGECGKGPGGSGHPGWESAASFPVCMVPAGGPATAAQWICNYPATVQVSAPNQLSAETWCDGLDNDCNGIVDDAYAKSLGTRCPEPGNAAVGACLRLGTWRCHEDKTLPAVCDLTGVAPAASPSDEVCDGLDNDCDGLVDEAWDNPAGMPQCADHDCRGVRDDVVRVNASNAPGGSYYIYRYESSRPDASATAQGASIARACSRAQGPDGAGVLPWSSVTWNQADAACRAAGMRLCRAIRAAGFVTSDEWGFACRAGQTCAGAYPYACSYAASACNGAELGLASAVACGSLAECSTKGDLDTESTSDQVFDLSGNLAEWTDDRRDIQDTAGAPAGAGTDSAIYTLRGGAFDSFVGGMTCDFMGTQVHPNFAFSDTGFRCCSSCPPGQAECSGVCKDLSTDNASCGACGTACAAGATCQNGVCK